MAVEIHKSFPIIEIFASSGASTSSLIWGNIIGTLSNQTDLQTALDGKASATPQFLTLATHSGISNERVFTPSSDFTATDGGAGSTYGLALATQGGLAPGTYNTVTVNAKGIVTAATTSTGLVLADGTIYVGNASNIATSVSMSDEATIDNTGAVTLSNSAVIGKVLTGFSSGAGTLAATDTILEAIQKLNGNIGAIGGGAISELKVAAASNTIDNASYLQEWQWNTLGASTGLRLSSTSTAAASNTQRLFSVLLSGANSTSTQTTTAAYFSNTHTGTNSTNIAGYFVASGGTTNYAIQTSGAIDIGGNINTSGTVHNFTGANAQLIFTGTSSQIRVQSIAPASNAVTSTIYAPQDATTIKLRIANNNFAAIAPTSGSPNLVYIGNTFSPTSGTATYENLKLNSIVNQTGGANGNVHELVISPTYTAVGGDAYGIYYNPTVTSITGNHYAAGFGSGNVGIGTLTPINTLQVVGNVTLGDSGLAGSRTINVSSSTGNANLVLDPQGSTGQVIVGSRFLQLGETTDGDTVRTLACEGTETNIVFDIYSKGSTAWLDLNGHFQVYEINSLTRAQIQPNSYTGLQFIEGDSYFSLKAIGVTSAPADLRLLSSGEGTNPSGHIYLDTASGGSETVFGNIGLFTTSVEDWQDMEKGLFVGNITTEPSVAIANGIALYSKDSSDGSTNSTLAMYLEQAVEVIGTFTPSHKLKVWINGTEYWIQLDAV